MSSSGDGGGEDMPLEEGQGQYSSGQAAAASLAAASRRTGEQRRLTDEMSRTRRCIIRNAFLSNT